MYPPRPIWYPEKSKDLSMIKDVVGYPFPIEEPIRQVWNPISRYGCVVSLKWSGGKTKHIRRYVHLSENNILSLCSLPKAMKTDLLKNRLLIDYKALRAISKIKNLIR